MDLPLLSIYGKMNDLCQYENFLSQNKLFLPIKIIYLNNNYFNSGNHFMSIKIIFLLCKIHLPLVFSLPLPFSEADTLFIYKNFMEFKIS